MPQTLPGGFEEKYKSTYLKQNIMDIGLWEGCPRMNSPEGIRRLQENDLLLSFIDQYFPNGPYAFEPNMEDHRMMFLPENVNHQGVGVCISKKYKGYLEVGHFWYPEEFKKKGLGYGIDQTYFFSFVIRPNEELVKMIQRLYIEEKSPPGIRFCTFAFLPNVIVGLKGYFMDDVGKAEKVIRERLENCDPQVRRNGERLIMFMNRVGNRK